MNRPGILLLVLMVCAAIAGKVLIGIHDANTATPNPPSKAGEDLVNDPEPTPAPSMPLTTATESGPAGALEGQLLNEAFQLSKGRALTFPEALDFVPTSIAGIQKAWQALVLPSVLMIVLLV